MTLDKWAARLWLREIRDILNRHWDPLGGCPEDEYESYAVRIAAMIRDRATDQQLVSYLESAEVNDMAWGRLLTGNGRKEWSRR